MTLHQTLMVLAWLAGWVLFWRLRTLPPVTDEGADTTSEPITVVIPARNEAETLPLLLGDLESARPPGTRVIVVDDHSEDNTAEVARAFDFVEVVSTPPLEEGWIGKSWACHHGASLAHPGALVFLDADVRFHGDALARVVSAWTPRGGLLTVWPYHTVERPYEHLSALFNVVTVMGVGCASLIAPRRSRGGFGPVMVTSTEAYARVGGHSAIRASVIDDFALTRAYSDLDETVTHLGGGDAVAFRMYPKGFGSLLEGWTKNLGAGAGTLQPWRVATLAAWAAVSLGSFKWGGGVPELLPTILCILYAVQIYVMFRQVGRFGVIDALLYPVHVLFLTLVFSRSLWRTYVRRKVVWRGRDISTKRSA